MNRLHALQQEASAQAALAETRQQALTPLLDEEATLTATIAAADLHTDPMVLVAAQARLGVLRQHIPRLRAELAAAHQQAQRARDQAQAISSELARACAYLDRLLRCAADDLEVLLLGVGVWREHVQATHQQILDLGGAQPRELPPRPPLADRHSA
jgi:chromosome segregation ATPase